MVAILIEPNFSNSTWCRKMYDSLVAGLRSKRIPYCEIFDTYTEKNDGVFIIASDYEWIRTVIRQFNDQGVKPIVLCNQLEHIAGCLYSCVCSDLNASMQNLLVTLKRQGKKRIALYGVNRNSISDMGRVNSLYAWREGNCESMQIFPNEGSLKKCFESFLPEAEHFDVAVCANDFTAVSLLRWLKERNSEILKRLEIICCTRMEISAGYPEILSMNLHYNEYGKEAVRIWEQLQKYPYLSCLTSGIAWGFGGEECDEQKEYKNGTGSFVLQLPETRDGFYKDPELVEMMTVDRFLNLSDETDRDIVRELNRGTSYEKIAEQCFLTEGGVKYRVRRMMQYCQMTDREELLRLLKKYLAEQG